MNDPLGTLGPYTLLAELGRGGMGVVYRARHPALEREFALKVIQADVEADPEMVERFQREARAGAGLSGHPGIVPVTDVGEAGGRWYLAMELVDGTGLDEAAGDDGFAPLQIARIGRDVAHALAYAHDRGVLHRDLKPANILITRSGEPRLTDFGLAKRHTDPEVTRLTQSGELLGTPAYMAPEQARGEAVDGRADLYALGATLYELCAGAPPFTADSIMGVMAQVLREEPRSLRTVAPHIPAPLAAVIHRCLEKGADDRYASAAALAADLDRFLDGVRVDAMRPGGARSRARRRRGVVVAGVAAGVCAVAAAAIWLVSRDRTAAGTVAAATAERTGAELRQSQAALYGRLTLATLAPMATLEDRWFGVAVPAEAVASAIAAVDAAASRSAGPLVSQSPAAWRALARFFAGDPAGMVQLEAAVERSADDPFPAALLARAHLAAFARAVEMPQLSYATTGPVIEPFRENAAMRTHREAAQAACRRALAAGGAVRDGSAAHALQLARGAAALGRRAYAAAASEFAALREDPALGVAADHLHALALLFDGRHGDAATRWTVAGRRGWVDPLRFAPQAHLAAGAAASSEGHDPRPFYRDAEAAATVCLDAYPQYPGVWRTRGIARRLLGAEERIRGKDGEAWVQRALADYGEAVQRDPSLTNLVNRANAYLELAKILQGRGADDREPLEAALADCTAASENGRFTIRTLVTRAGVCQELANRERRLGGSPIPWLDAGLEGLHAAWAQGERDPTFATMRATLLSNLGWETHVQGGDGRPPMDEALAVFDALITANPRRMEAWRNRAATRARIALILEQRHQPRGALWERAASDYAEAVRLAPAELQTHLALAMARHEVVLARQAAGEDPREELARIEQETTAAMDRFPGAPGLLHHRAAVHAARVRLEWNSAGGPVPHLAAAIEDLTALLEARPNDPGALFERATMHQGLGSYAKQRGEAWKPHFEAGVLDFNRSARADPRDWKPFAAGGDLLETLGRDAEAIAAFEAALTRNPTEPTTLARLERLRTRARPR